MDAPTQTVDPITTEVIGSALASIVEEMGEALIRASYSTNIKERRDHSCAVIDLQGRLIAQAENSPQAKGCHALIKQGAKLVIRGETMTRDCREMLTRIAEQRFPGVAIDNQVRVIEPGPEDAPGAA